MRHKEPEWYDRADKIAKGIAKRYSSRSHVVLSFDEMYHEVMTSLAVDMAKYDALRMDLGHFLYIRAKQSAINYKRKMLGIGDAWRPETLHTFPGWYWYEPILDVEWRLDMAQFGRYAQHKIDGLIWTDRWGNVILSTTIRNRRIMRRRFFGEETLKTIAITEGISYIRVHQIIDRGLEQLRDKCKPYYELCAA